MSQRFLGAIDAPTAREGIEGLLHAAVDTFCGGEGARGCLIMLGALNCTRHDYLFELRQQGPELVRQRLARGITDGDLPAGASVSDLTSFYTTVLQGLAIRAHDGASRQALMGVVHAAMAAWDPLVRQTRDARRKRSRSKTR